MLRFLGRIRRTEPTNTPEPAGAEGLAGSLRDQVTAYGGGSKYLLNQRIEEVERQLEAERRERIAAMQQATEAKP